MMGSKAFENPLIGHVRLRAMLRALLEVRALGERARCPLPRGLEACWVATSIDLRRDDLLSTTAPAWLLRHIRRVGLRESAQAVSKAETKRALREAEEERASGVRALDELEPYERVLCAAGSALAMRAAGGDAIAMAWIPEGALGMQEWTRLLRLLEDGGAPLVVLQTPSPTKPRRSVDLPALARELETRNVPVIPVDAGDPVALYRVSQESILRARQDRRAAVIAAIGCGTDPVELLSRQLVRKRICTERWVAAATAAPLR